MLNPLFSIDTIGHEISHMWTTRQPSTAFRPLPPDRRQKRALFAKSIGGFVPKIAAKTFERFGFHSAEILTSWPTIVGRDLAELTEPERIQWPRRSNGAHDDDGARAGAVLIVRVSAAHALDIEYRAGEIVDRINQYFGYRAIARVKILQAPLTHEKAKKPEISEPSGAQTQPVPVAAEESGKASPDPYNDLPDSVRQALGDLWDAISREKSKR